MSGPTPPVTMTCGQIASLAFLLYDICITLDDEVNIIWPKPDTSWIKWQFLFTRYFALAAQLANRSLESAINSDSTTLTSSLRGWYICQVFIGSIVMIAVEMVLMARVYALYKKTRWIALIFAALLGAEVTTLVVGVVKTVPGKEFHLDTFVERSPNSYAYFGIAAAVSQVAILLLTLIKYRCAVVEGWAKLPIIMLMVRDGTVAFLVLFTATIMTILSSVADGKKYPPIGNSWFLSVVACAGCRLIINMQRLPSSPTSPGSRSFPTTVELTSVYPESGIAFNPVSSLEEC